MLPGTIDGMRHVCYFRHALALDERRAKFLPEYAYGGSATCPTIERGPFSGSKDDLIVVEEPSFDRPLADNEAVVDRSQVRLKSTTTPPQTIEVWFAGTHSDM
jgi:hypothetical protein